MTWLKKLKHEVALCGPSKYIADIQNVFIEEKYAL